MTKIKVEVLAGHMSLEMFLNKIGVENIVQVLHGQSVRNVPVYTVIYKT